MRPEVHSVKDFHRSTPWASTILCMQLLSYPSDCWFPKINPDLCEHFFFLIMLFTALDFRNINFGSYVFSED